MERVEWGLVKVGGEEILVFIMRNTGVMTIMVTNIPMLLIIDDDDDDDDVDRGYAAGGGGGDAGGGGRANLHCRSILNHSFDFIDCLVQCP